MSTLELKNLSMSYGNTEVLNDININISSGEFMILVGPSGSGKSTILRAIAGLEVPSNGDIILDGVKINDLYPKERDIAMVFQNYALYPHLSVFENIAFPLKMMKKSKKDIDTAVSEAAELLGVSRYLMKKPKQLSGGERQRVALGRAIVRKPRLFLMDEPLSNLDAKLRSQMRTELLTLHHALSATFIYVTHDQTEALTMGDKIAVLNNGMVQQVDVPKNVYDFPSNTFVGGFIGNPPMNFFKFKLINSSKFQFMNFDYECTLPAPLLDTISSRNLLNVNLLLGIRPEHVILPKHNADFVFDAHVDLVEMLGFEDIVHISIQGSKFSLRNSSATDIPIGLNKFSLNFDKCVLYEESSGMLVKA